MAKVKVKGAWPLTSVAVPTETPLEVKVTVPVGFRPVTETVKVIGRVGGIVSLYGGMSLVLEGTSDGAAGAGLVWLMREVTASVVP